MAACPEAASNGTARSKCPWCDDWGQELVPDDNGHVHTPGPCRCCAGVAYHYNLSEAERHQLWEDYLTDMIRSYPQIGPLVQPPNGDRPLHPLRALELIHLLD